ncbi:MAG TPA: hypothetical protein VK399_08720 [Longimicrobiaceae bacterium]|jgi:hypothetical protein|nr:hypothetical protein [Longimicrobiaceae bacterium]
MTGIASTRAARFALATVIGFAIGAWTGEPQSSPVDTAPAASTAAAPDPANSVALLR